MPHLSSGITVCATGVHGYTKPADVYFPDEDLLQYFEGTAHAKFLVTSYSKDTRDLFRELGVAEVPRRIEVDFGDPPFRYRTTGGETIRNYVLDGLDNFLVRIGNEEDPAVRGNMSLNLWQYLVAYADAGINCFQATRQYYYYSQKFQYYDSHLAHSLRETAWLSTADGGLVKPPEMSIDLLPDEFEQNQKLIAALQIRPDPSQQVEQERQAKRSLAEQLGIKLEDAEFIRQNRAIFEHFRSTTLSRAAHQQFVDESTSPSRERRRMKLRQRREKTAKKQSVMKLRSVPSHSRSDIDRQTLFDFYLDEEVEAAFCQVCLDPMPFVKRNGEDCGECVTLFTQGWADATGFELKPLTSLNLVLCPVCSEVYRDYVHKDVEKQTALFGHLTGGNENGFVICEPGVRRDQKDYVLHFNQTHLEDIRDDLGQNDE